MPIVNYVREHVRFMEYASDEHLTPSERLLWYALMHVMNQRAQGRVWPDEFIRISNDRLLSLCPMKYDTLAAARNGLKQRGLIEYTRGEKNKVSPSYRMIYFYPEYAAPETEADGEEFYPKKPDKSAVYPKKSDYMGGNMGGNIGGNMGGNSGDYIINYTDKDKYNPKRICEEDDEEEEDLLARARAEVNAAWTENFGRRPTPAIVNRIAQCARMLHFDKGVAAKAIYLAAAKGVSSPVDYALQVLADWYRQNVKTKEDADEYGFIFDAVNGRTPEYMSVEEGLQELDSFRQDRETDEEREAREEREDRADREREERSARITRNKAAREQEEYRHELERLGRKYEHAARTGTD